MGGVYQAEDRPDLNGVSFKKGVSKVFEKNVSYTFYFHFWFSLFIFLGRTSWQHLTTVKRLQPPPRVAVEDGLFRLLPPSRSSSSSRVRGDDWTGTISEGRPVPPKSVKKHHIISSNYSRRISSEKAHTLKNDIQKWPPWFMWFTEVLLGTIPNRVDVFVRTCWSSLVSTFDWSCVLGK